MWLHGAAVLLLSISLGARCFEHVDLPATKSERGARVADNAARVFADRYCEDFSAIMVGDAFFTEDNREAYAFACAIDLREFRTHQRWFECVVDPRYRTAACTARVPR